MAEYGSGYGKRPLWQWILIYLVVGGIVYGIIYYFVWGKNGGYNYGSSGSNTNYNYSATAPTSSMTAAPTEPSMQSKVTIQLAAENGSGQSGTATLEEANGKTTVTVDITGEPSGASQPDHIHIGACPGVGAVKYPLNPVVSGKSITVLDVTLAQLKTQLPLALNVHKSASQANVYVACGAVSL